MSHDAIGNALFLALIIAFVIVVTMALSGDGGLKRATTLSGMYAVPDVGGYPVICFTQKTENAGIHCIPRAHLAMPRGAGTAP